MSWRTILITALAPLVWGSTYIVTTTFLPPDRPLYGAALRVLPAGLLMLAWARQLPPPGWWGRVILLAALNIGLFQAALFVGAYRLPGGVAATLGAVAPLVVAGLSWPILGVRPGRRVLVAGMMGLAGVAALVLGPAARLDGWGVAAALAGALCMALGVVLCRRWPPPVAMIPFTAWQLVAGGVMLVPAAILTEPPLPALSGLQVGAYAYLGLIGAGLAYFLWFRGIARLSPSLVASLGLLSPLSATMLGWLIAGQHLTAPQWGGAALVLAALWLAARRNTKSR